MLTYYITLTTRTEPNTAHSRDTLQTHLIKGTLTNCQAFWHNNTI